MLLRKPFPFLFSFLEHYLQILKHDTIAILDQFFLKWYRLLVASVVPP